MPQDRELDQLKDEQDRAFQRKQDAWQRQNNAWQLRMAAKGALDLARNRQQDAYDVQQHTWQRRRSAQDETSHAFEAKQDAHTDQQEAWEELQRLRDTNGPRISALRDEHDNMFERIKSLSGEIDYAFSCGNKDEAFEKIEEVKQLRTDIGYLPPQWRELSAEINEAKDLHARATEKFRPLQAEFVRLRSISDGAKADHVSAVADFKATQATWRQAQAEFEAAKAEHECCLDEFHEAKHEAERTKEAFSSRLAELRAEQLKFMDDKLSLAQQAGVPPEYWEDVWVSTDNGGNINIYFGGIGEPAGEGHGHYAMNSTGYVTYRRDPFDPHGAQNFTDYLEPSKWTPPGSQAPDAGVIAGTDHIVSFKTGGPNRDETLIADGDYSDDKEGFDKSHNHYGSASEGGWIDQDRGHYTGPDH